METDLVVSRPKLSICIATFNRAQFIAELLESLVQQLTSECEIVVSDNASTDRTEDVIASFAFRCARLRYFKQAENVGIDRNFDRAVELSEGEYCWLMADDDLLKATAITEVLGAIRGGFSLIIANYERKNFNMSKIVLNKYLDIDSNRMYDSNEIDRLFGDTAELLIYIGCIVIKRALWISRERERYYGSMLMYIGVIFQEAIPGETLLIANPLVSYRDGNIRSFLSEMFEIFMFKFPALIWSLPPSDCAKEKISSREPWRNSFALLWHRALGFYSLKEYRSLIHPRLSSAREMLAPALVAVLPGIFVNTVFVIYYFVTRHRLRDLNLLWLATSPFHLTNYGRAVGVDQAV